MESLDRLRVFVYSRKGFILVGRMFLMLMAPPFNMITRILIMILLIIFGGR
jgi:hypothetical protein